MDAIKVSIGELCKDPDRFMLHSGQTLAVTNSGETVGYFIPTRKKMTDADAEALLEAARTVEALLAAKGLTEDMLMADFDDRRKAARAAKSEQKP
jgi:hypothetical protein